ncbi:MAG TPA: PP2C family protein-serine/threonine phosphatase, partial [Phycisphaerales bacterium]|nr:PP2C family protein-serine/threonine phosphatase [Phycisphaerales bacterium]
GGGATLPPSGHATTRPAHPGGAGAQVGSTMMRERVERVAERDLAAVNQNRLKLLMEVAAAVAGTGTEASLARMIVDAAAQGSGFPRAYLLKDETIASPDGSEGGVDTLSVMAEVDPDAAASADGGTGEQVGNATGGRAASATQSTSTSSFSRSLIAAARKGEIVRLTSDAPMQAQSIMSLGIQTALCVPILSGGAVGAFLYLDARADEKNTGKTRGAVAPLSGTGGVHSDAAAFCGALAKMYGLALGNISRLDLERRQKELVRDLEAASEAQKLIMPPASGAHGCVRYAMKSKSGRYVAGDLFDVVDLEDGRVGVLLGDVAGKGVPAAILMATAQTHLHVALREGKDPARAVRAVNAHICSHMASSKFISLWMGVFEPREGGGGTLTYIDAGHGYWLILGPKGETVHRNEAATGIPLGIEPTYEFEATKVDIQPGQRLVVFSDGVVEQPGGESGEQFGVEGTIGALKGAASESDDVERVFKAVLAHAKGPNLADDTTVASVGM